MRVRRWLLAASLLFVALAWGPAAAHLLELPNKIGFSGDDYLAAQQSYRGWALLGIVVVTALLPCGALALATRHTPVFPLALGVFLSIVATQVVFWTFTFPANQATENWTTLPSDWTAVRARWEYSHAASAALDLLALILLLAASLRLMAGALM